MASPVSFGDAYQMSRLAFKLGKAFTKGRKSAPAEFREVENQLYSLSGALRAFQAESQEAPTSVDVEPSTQPRDRENVDVLRHVIGSCSQTLKHLESITEKYSIIGKPKDGDTNRPRFKRWNENLRHAWKTILWTTEGGDLAALRSNLVVHTNSLNLLLSVIISSQTGRIENRVERIETMLRDIYIWFTENLNSSTLGSVTGPQDRGSGSPPSEKSFELHKESGRQIRLVCPHASFISHGLSTNDANYAQHSLFVCQCDILLSDQNSHKAEVSAYGLSPLSFCTRLVGKERVLMLYKASDRNTHSLISLFLKRVPLSGLADCEELFLHTLTIHQAKSMLRRDMNTMLCFKSDGESSLALAHILNLAEDITAIRNTIKSVTFTSEQLSYTRESVESVQIVHYKTTDLNNLLNNHSVHYPTFNFEDSAEIVLFYDATSLGAHQTNADIVRTTLHLKSNTQLSCDTGETALVFKKIDCTGYTTNEEGHPITGVEVTICFTDIGSALSFEKKAENMRMELFILSLQYPRIDERRVLRVQAYDVHTEHLHIADAEILILQNIQTQLFRLVIVSRNGYSVISQELTEDFFEFISLRTRPNFTSLTNVVQLDNSGTRKVYRYPKGFTFLGFSDAKVENLFKLGLANVAGTMQALPDPAA